MSKTLSKSDFLILLVGDAVFYGRLASYKKAFEKLGHRVKVLDVRSFYRIGFLNKALNRFLPKSKPPIYFGTKRLNAEIVKETEKINPDFILFFKPIFIKPGTLYKIKSGGIKIFSWYPDDIFYLKNSSRDFYNTIPVYDCHFSTKSFNVAELLRSGAQKAVFLPHAVDASCHHPLKVSPEEKKKIGSDIVFVGTYADDKRVEYLEKLCNDGYDIKIYGNGWDNIPRNFCLKRNNCVRFKAFFCSDLSRVFNASKIALAFLRKHNRDLQTSRTYEIPACGAFMLHERTDEATNLFKEGKEADFFGTYEEMKNKIDFYLSHSEERNNIARAGYERAVLYDYSYQNRAQNILDIYFKLRQ